LHMKKAFEIQMTCRGLEEDIEYIKKQLYEIAREEEVVSFLIKEV